MNQDPTPPAQTRPDRAGGDPRSLVLVTLPFIIVAAAVALVFAQTRGLALLGFDTYPLILTGRMQSLGDFLGTFTEQLMDGRYPDKFYRPALSLTFALDHALWGLRPWGYHLTDALLFGAAALALFGLVRRLAAPRASVAAYVTLLLLLLHPTQWEVLPVPARRAELMCGLAVALSLLLQLRPRALAGRRPPVGPALCMMAAIASKETALLFPALSFLAVLLYAPRPGSRQRLARAGLAMIPHAVVIGIMLAARFAVLGGLGGHEEARGLGQSLAATPTVAAILAQELIAPQTITQGSSLGIWLVAIVLAGLVVTAVLIAWFPRSPQADGPERLGPAAAIASGWLVLVIVAYAATADAVMAWYLYLAVAGFAMLIGIVAEGLVATLRRGNLAQRISAGLTLALVIVWALGQFRYSPLLHEYDQWPRATRASNEFLAALEARIAGAPDGSIVTTPPVPTWMHQPDGPTRLYGVAVLHTHSIQAWAELTFPNRRVRVHADAAAPRAAPDEVVVVPAGPLERF
jgi:hypothetical protein